MAKHIVAKEVPADEVKEIVEAFEALGATNIKETKQDDGTFTIECDFA